MAFKDSAGNRFTNHSSMKSSEAKLKAKGPSATPEAEDPMDSEDPQDGAAMAQEHGPASQLDIDHTQGHRVHAMHPDGHEHDSEHASADEAHRFAAQCAGVGM